MLILARVRADLDGDFGVLGDLDLDLDLCGKLDLCGELDLCGDRPDGDLRGDLPDDDGLRRRVLVRLLALRRLGLARLLGLGRLLLRDSLDDTLRNARCMMRALPPPRDRVLLVGLLLFEGLSTRRLCRLFGVGDLLGDLFRRRVTLLRFGDLYFLVRRSKLPSLFGGLLRVRRFLRLGFPRLGFLGDGRAAAIAASLLSSSVS